MRAQYYRFKAGSMFHHRNMFCFTLAVTFVCSNLYLKAKPYLSRVSVLFFKKSDVIIILLLLLLQRFLCIAYLKLTR